MSGKRSGVDAKRKRADAANESGDIQREIQREMQRDDAAGGEPLPRTAEQFAAALEKARNSERMKILAEKRWNGTESPPSSPANDGLEMVNLHKHVLADIGILKTTAIE